MKIRGVFVQHGMHYRMDFILCAVSPNLWQKPNASSGELLLWCNVATVGTPEALTAERMNLPDMEDAMQMAAAAACQSDVIFTHNLPDFTTSAIPALALEEFLLRYPP